MTAPEDCQRVMMQGTKPYPRTCPRCKLGPCPYFPKPAAPAVPTGDQLLRTYDLAKDRLAFSDTQEHRSGYREAKAALLAALAKEPTQ